MVRSPNSIYTYTYIEFSWNSENSKFPSFNWELWSRVYIELDLVWCIKVIETNHESKSITHFTTRFWMKQPSNRHVCLRNIWPDRICWPNRSSIHSITIAHHHLNRNTTGTHSQLTLNRFGYLFSWNVHFLNFYFIFRKSLENELTL